jgi:hypothetical protein
VVAVTRRGYQGLLRSLSAICRLLPRVGRQQKIHSLHVKKKSSKMGQVVFENYVQRRLVYVDQ